MSIAKFYKKVFAIIENGKIRSLKKTSREIGISSGTLSAYRNKNYNSSIGAIEEK
jgi:DNA transposition AAA+ family ATPase